MPTVEIIAFSLVTVFVTLIVMEGLASLALSFRDRRTVLWATGRKRSIHDSDLGWVNKPNTHIPDLYGPGRDVRINSQGFRNSHEFAPIAEGGRIRVICSGDSFTFGEGVDNDRTWCQLLGSLDPRFEPVNMGQTGYGIDQAYLWYKRDGLRFEHQVHVLSFITDDFYRMQSAVFAGYAKPVLEVVNGGLVVTNVPVPRRSYYLTWLARHVKSLSRFRTVEFLNRAFRKLFVNADSTGPAQDAGNKKTREVLRKIFEDLNRLNEERSIQPVLVYLPTLHELMGHGNDPQEWVEFLRAETKALGIPLFDVMNDFRKLPAHEVVRMYNPEGQLGPNHFNDRGNAFVAEVIYEGLKNHPSIAQRPVPTDLTREFWADRSVPVPTAPVSASVDQHVTAERSVGLSVGRVCAAAGAVTWWRGYGSVAATLFFVAASLISSASARSRS
jgi:hypothetical protein